MIFKGTFDWAGHFLLLSEIRSKNGNSSVRIEGLTEKRP